MILKGKVSEAGSLRMRDRSRAIASSQLRRFCRMRRFRMMIVQVRSQMVSKDDFPGHGLFEKALLHVAWKVRPQSERGPAQQAFELVR